MRRSTLFLCMAWCLPAMVAVSPAQATDRGLVLQPTTIEDWRAAGTDGTGCYWSAHRAGPVLFAASGRIGVTKVAGRVVVLAPAPRARAMFPFTHDAWRSGGLTIRVMDSGIVHAMGEEAVTTDATLIVTQDGTTKRFRGSMICGS